MESINDIISYISVNLTSNIIKQALYNQTKNFAYHDCSKSLQNCWCSPGLDYRKIWKAIGKKL